MNKNPIPIKNIYYMLCYAFEYLQDTFDDIKSDKEDFITIYDLFSKILSILLSHQVKKGLYKNYLEEIEELSCIKGKINFSSSIAKCSLLNKRLVCQYEEFSENTLENQIIKSTLLLLLKEDISIENKKQLSKYAVYFQNVEETNLKRVQWNNISYHKNNISYQKILNICFFICHNLLITKETGSYKLCNFFNEEQLNKIFEKFVLNYYIRNHSCLNAKSEEIKWNVIPRKNKNSLIPRMVTDITLHHNNKILIIDTKFYSQILQKNYGADKYNANNLYQIYSYVKNMDKHNTGNVSGMLLYAQTSNETIKPVTYNFNGNEITITSLNLNTEWIEIEKSLNTIADKFKKGEYS